MDMYFGTVENAPDSVCLNAYFRAESLMEAKKIAVDMGLKDFAKMGRVYVKGVDY